MIVPMLKYQFVLYHKDSPSFIRELMELGVVQIVDKGKVNDNHTQQLENEIKESKLALGHLINRKIKAQNQASETLSLPPSRILIEKEHQLEALRHKVDKIETEIGMLEPWGGFNWEDVHKLEDKTNLRIRFVQYPAKKFKDEWTSFGPISIVNEEKGVVYFLLFQQNEDLTDLPFVPSSLPRKSLAELKEEKGSIQANIDKLNSELNDYATTHRKDLKYRIDETTDELSFQVAYQDIAPALDDRIHVLEGWVPKTEAKNLRSYLDQNKIVYVEYPAEKEDNPPILLKNNWFAKLFEPIGNLFSLPGYGELDLTVFFAPFFFLFFGFCLGDAGYGMVLFLGATGMRIFMKKSKIKVYLPLMQLFGLATTLVGFISGTLFGLEMAGLPQFESISHLFFSQDQLFNIALYIGFTQIIFALFIQAYKEFIFNGVIYSISKLGWILLLLSLGDLYVTEYFMAISKITVWVGLTAIVLFGAPGKGALRSVGYGVADLYNITGVMGDLLSYIRLFALGVSSAILGLVVNNIAMEFKEIPYVGIGLFVLILVVGHSANIALASLSAFVHPMRLTFVEFYKNAGFQGGGKPFQPLIKLSKNK